MRVLVTGGAGALARALVAAGTANGHEVLAPARRELDASDLEAMLDALRVLRPDVVVAAAACANVTECEVNRAVAMDGNVATTTATTHACNRSGIPCVWISTDYVVEGDDALPAEPRLRVRGELDRIGNVYGLSKCIGEHVAIAHRAVVARVSFVASERAKSYAWLNGYTLANREWEEECAARIVQFLEHAHDHAGRVVHLVSPRAVTVADLVRERFPDHPGLRDVVTSPEEFERRAGYRAPVDVRLVAW
jgi:dTDP-4-dehydrorhamnose reductase